MSSVRQTDRGTIRSRTEEARGGSTPEPQVAPRLSAVVGDYFRELSERFGQGWNLFWFVPADALTLSVVRVLAGLVALYTILTFTPDLVLLFGPDGLLAADSLRNLPGGGSKLSYLNYLHSPTSLWIGHFAGLGVIAAFTLGLFTRLTSVLSLAVVLSYFHRSFILTSEMEPVLSFLMLYLCLAPTGAYLSMDRWLARRRGASAVPGNPTPHWSTTVATRLIQVHLAIVYLMMLLAQLNENAWWDGTAMWWLAGRRDSALVDLTWLYQYPFVVNAWTHGFVLYEGAFIALIWNRLAAPLLVAVGVVAWGLMALVTGLVPLAVIMVIASLTFIQPAALRKLLGSCGLSGLAG